MASFSFHQRINIRRHILSDSQLQDVFQVAVREPWAQLCFINAHYRENLLTKICGSEHGQQLCSEGCQVGVTWQEVLIKCVQASCGKFALQIRITLQVNYFKLDVDGKIRGWMASKQLWSLSPVHQKSENVAQTPVTVPLFYLWTASCLRHVGSRTHVSDRGSELHHHRRVASPTMTASTWKRVCCPNTLLHPCSRLFKVFRCSVTSTMNARPCIHFPEWNSHTGLSFSSINCSISSRKSQKRLSPSPRLNHLTSVWYGKPLMWSFSLRRLSNWRWFGLLDRMKCTVWMTTFMMWSNFNDLQHKASWCKIQWKVQKSRPPFADRTFSANILLSHSLPWKNRRMTIFLGKLCTRRPLFSFLTATYWGNEGDKAYNVNSMVWTVCMPLTIQLHHPVDAIGTAV